MSSINQALRRTRHSQNITANSGPLMPVPVRAIRRRSGYWIAWAGLAAVLTLAGLGWWWGWRPAVPPGAAPIKASPAGSNLDKGSAPPVPPGAGAESSAVSDGGNLDHGLAAVSNRVAPGASPSLQPPASLESGAGVENSGGLEPAPASHAGPAPWPSRSGSGIDPTPPDGTAVTAADHFEAALAAQDQGREEKAMEHYLRAITLDPGLSEAYLNLGNIYLFGRKDQDKAGEMYRRALAVNPADKMAHNNLGVLYMNQGQSGRAEAEFAAALELDDNYVDALYNLACLTARQGRTGLALSYLLKAGRLQPEAAVWAAEDEDLKALRGLPEFKAFVESGPRAAGRKK
ncbi:MAG: tetratricopeptide repeat protein [Thermodesulfobacteriota bacterium]